MSLASHKVQSTRILWFLLRVPTFFFKSHLPILPCWLSDEWYFAFRYSLSQWCTMPRAGGHGPRYHEVGDNKIVPCPSPCLEKGLAANTSCSRLPRSAVSGLLSGMEDPSESPSPAHLFPLEDVLGRKYCSCAAHPQTLMSHFRAQKPP